MTAFLYETISCIIMVIINRYLLWFYLELSIILIKENIMRQDSNWGFKYIYIYIYIFYTR